MTTQGQVVTAEVFQQIRDKYLNWDRWGDDDEIGTLNFATNEKVGHAAGLVKSGQVLSLALPIEREGPTNPPYPRFSPVHLMTRDGGDVRRAFDQGERGFQYTDDVITMPLQCTTQWDALAHIFYNGQMYGGRPPEDVPSLGALRNSITATKDRMVGRGVLLDIPRMLGRDWLKAGEAIENEDLEKCCESQSVEVGPGDFLLVRTGRLGAVKARGSWGDEFSAGVAAGLGVSAAHFLCTRDVAAVATDTFAAEVIPAQTEAAGIGSPLHVLILQGRGIHIGEMFDLEELAAACAKDGVYEFLFVGAPITVTGAVGSPVNPLAIR
ncbi:cyclase family protein [Pseudarthrobacter sp. YAF2]|uniref:cyclase family protein n=1 Tax=Pseudarthrobacter sp. YAF2 TaxID=3233078 RepID=UPI003F96B11A